MDSGQVTTTENESPVSAPGNLRNWSRRIVWLGGWFASIIVWAWCLGFVLCLDDYLPKWMALLLGAFVLIVFPVLCYRNRTSTRFRLVALVSLFLICFAGHRMMWPSHERDWGEAQAKLPFAEFNLNDESVVVNNIRSFRYGPNASSKLHYSDTYDLSKLKTVWFGVDRFTEFQPLAHTFLSFEFEPGEHRTNYLAFSVETRRETHETLYSPIRGIFNNYETIYVIADEQDVLSVRSDVREHVVHLYPVKATREQARKMFIDMLKRANGIKDQPEFYHTLTSNCTNNIVYHTNQVLEEPISSWQRGVIFPGYSDWLAYQKGIIDTELTLNEAREKFRIDQRVKTFDGKSDFSEFIRGR